LEKAVYDFVSGEILLVDKPLGWTSTDVVRKMQGVTGFKKIGHAGTLDPLATGLLILCTGKKTKEIQGIQDAEKEYYLEFILGAVTDSYDAEFPPKDIRETDHISEEQVKEKITGFTGTVTQFPPSYSAVKIGGKRAYNLARAGKEVKTEAREVQVREFELLHFSNPGPSKAVVRCSKGTYIRSLVHDLGQTLECGAYLSGLRRTKIGDYFVEQAKTPEEWSKLLNRKPANEGI
jgi:tRNA pseudouridine55 synthase